MFERYSIGQYGINVEILFYFFILMMCENRYIIDMEMWSLNKWLNNYNMCGDINEVE